MKYYSKLLSENRPEYQEPPQPEINIEGEEIYVDTNKIKTAIMSLKNGRACGPEGVYAELIKSGSKKLFRMLTNIVNQCLNGHPVPEQWKKAYISSIYKKGSRKDPNNYRGISVTSTMSRLYGRILRNLIEEEYSSYEEEEQNGFRSGRSCTDNIFALKQIIEKKSAMNQEVHITFIDLQKAYDTVPIIKLWEVLHESRINAALIKAVQNLYHGGKSQIKTVNGLSEEISITKGLRQGCCISPTLFKIYIAKALHLWKRKCNGMGIELNDICLYTLQFADDQAIIANDKDDMEYMVRKIIEEYAKWGLTVNTEKTKYLPIGANTENLILDNNMEIRACEDYRYLGSIFTGDGTDDREINNRVIQARRVIRCINGILWSTEITKNRKYNIYETLVKSILLYGCETWRLTERNKRKLETTEMDAIRRAMRISRRDKIRNEDIRQQMGIEGTIVNDIEQKQLIWYGHVQRMHNERIPKQVIHWIPPGKRKRGRPKKTWMEGIRRSMSEKNLTEDQWENRTGWKLGIGQRRRTF